MVALTRLMTEIALAKPHDMDDEPFGTDEDSYGGMADQWWTANGSQPSWVSKMMALAHEAAAREDPDELRTVLVQLAAHIYGWIEGIDEVYGEEDESE